MSTTSNKLKTGTKQWAPNSENCIIGDVNNCRYCYAKKNYVRFKRGTPDSWTTMRYNPRCQKRIFKHDGLIMFPTSHDLHMETQQWWLPFLRGLLEKGNDVLIVSKPREAVICLICHELAEFKDHIEFRFTIGSAINDVLRFWEPGAPSFHERLAALMTAHVLGFRTSVSIEPLLDYDPSILIEMIRPYVTETIWIGCMNHMSVSDFARDEMQWYDRMIEINSRENMQKIYAAFWTDPAIRWKDSVQRLLGVPESNVGN
jgi:DNA repair photolyase